MRRLIGLAALALLALHAGCRDPAPPDPAPAPAPAPAIAPPSCAALKLAATADHDALRAAGLSTASADAILAFRAGADGTPDTADDRAFLAPADLAGLALAPADLAALEDGPPCGEVPLQLLAFNDFHGALEPPSGRAGQIETPEGPVDAGGAEYVATWLERLADPDRPTLIVAAGDNIGATPLLSAAFQDEPTIEALNLVGLALSSVGNHEFDEGLAELLRMQHGGCHPDKGCFRDTPFAGARFAYLAANVIVDATGETPFPPYAIRRFGKVPVAFIGMTLEGTPEVVTPAGTAGLSFRDEADTVNALVPELEALGVRAIVVLLHEGGFATGHYSGCEGISGPIVDVVARFDRQVDVVVSGHTNAAHVCDLGGILVTSAAHNGRLVTDLALVLDEATHDVARKSARNVVVSRDVPRHPAMTTLLDAWRPRVADFANRVVGTLAEDLLRKPTEAGEMPLGSVIADAMLFAEADPSTGAAELAWVNSGGVRADLLRVRPGAPDDAPSGVTFGDIFTVQPFGNQLVTMTLTGAQIEAVLEAQFHLGGEARARPKRLQVAHTLRYAFDPAGPPGDKVDPRHIEVAGAPLDLERRYRVTMNDFLAQGGDGFDALREGVDRRLGVMDIDALQHYLRHHPDLAAPAPGRIRLAPATPSGADPSR